MKLNNKYISSLDSFRANFNFIEVWNKLDIFMRDLSPNDISYSSPDDKLLYDAICTPADIVKLSHGRLTIKGVLTLELRDDEVQLQNTAKIPDPVLIQIICLLRLAKVAIPHEIDKAFRPVVVNMAMPYIELSCGQSIELQYKDITEGILLNEKLIKVAKDADLPSDVGGVILQPGEFTYGIFCDDRMINVCRRRASNKQYALEFVTEDDMPILKVKDRTTGMVVSKFKHAHYFALLGDYNFAVIDGASVISKTDEDLNSRLRKVERAFSPKILECNQNTLTIIYESGKKETFIFINR